MAILTGVECLEKQKNLTEVLENAQDIQVESLDLLRDIIIHLTGDDIYQRPSDAIDNSNLSGKAKLINGLSKTINSACHEINTIIRG